MLHTLVAGLPSIGLQQLPHLIGHASVEAVNITLVYVLPLLLQSFPKLIEIPGKWVSRVYHAVQMIPKILDDVHIG